ncbi:MAG: hypothetical protein Q9226_005040, partial [Calogaya cf. arnoldii]
MKLTTIVTVFAAVGAEVAFAIPVAQQAPVKPNPLLAKDLDPKIRSPADAPASLCFSSTPAGLEGLTAATSPYPTPGAPKPLCFASSVAGLGGLTAATVPCPTPGGGGGVVSQISDGQVQAPVSATGNPVSLTTVPKKGAADTLPTDS